MCAQPLKNTFPDLFLLFNHSDCEEEQKWGILLRPIKDGFLASLKLISSDEILIALTLESRFVTKSGGMVY